MRASCLVLVVVLLLFSVLLLTDYSVAQSVYGQVLGRLTSVSGTPVSGAVISMVSVGTGARAGAKSNPEGDFAINNVSADLYQIEVRADGFKRVQATIVVSANSTTTVNVPLQAGDPSAIVENKTAGASVLELDRTDIATPFDLRTIAGLPLRDQNVTQLELLVPGSSRGRLFITPNQNPQGGQPVNINGQHFSGSAFQLDGTENRDPLEGIVVINPALDSVREMKVTTQGYNAEFGQATAGVATVQTQSGSNNWHGAAYGYRRTGWGESVNPFAPAGVPPEKHSIFGGSLGGPILRNKLFIFGNYQSTRVRQGSNLLLSVPPAGLLDQCTNGKANGEGCDLSAYKNFVLCPTGQQPPCPLHDTQSSQDNPFTIPSGQISNSALAILSFLPDPNHVSANPSCGDANICDNFLASGNEIFDGDQLDIRGDVNVNSAVRLFGRYSFGDYRDDGTPAFGIAAGGIGTNPVRFAGIDRTRNQGIAAGFTYSLSPKLLTDFRFGYFRYRLKNDSNDVGKTPDIKIPNIFASETGDPFATGMPDIQIPGQQNTGQPRLASNTNNDYFRLGYSLTADNCNCPLREREQQFQFVNNWTRSAGKHIFKWGADLRYLQNYRLASEDPRTGFFSFAPSNTGLGLATFLLGKVTSFNRYLSTSAATDAGERQKRFGFYGQDSWRINPRLTVDYGLRWEIYFAQNVTGAGRGSFLIPNLSNPDPRASFFNVAHGENTGGISTSLKNFGPRVGFAYLLNPATVIRAGYGRSFDAGYAGSIFGIAPTQSPPITVDQNVESGGFTLDNGPPQFCMSGNCLQGNYPFPSGSQFSLFDLGNLNRKIPANKNNPTAIPASGAILYGLPSRVRVPTVDSWNLAVQHQLAAGLYFELAYVGNKGTHVFQDNGAGTFYNLNQPTLQNIIAPVPNGVVPATCNQNAVFPDVNPAYCLVQPRFRTFYNSFPSDSTDCGKVDPVNHPCFDPLLFQVRYFGNNASNNYHSLQTKLVKNFSRGYSFMAHYTFSKGLDYSANYFRVDPRVGYGPAQFDLTHRFVMTNVWNLPIGRGRSLFGEIGTTADRFLGGWTLSAVTIWRSGLPFTPSYNDCGKDTLGGGLPCVPNRVGLVDVSDNRNEAFTTTGGTALLGTDCNSSNFCGVDPNTGNSVAGPANSPWQRPGAGQIGNAGRNSLRGPSFFQSDIGVAKTVALSERSRLAFRADIFNVFNKVNLGNPNPCVDCSGGGSINSLAQGAFQREFQFSLRIEF